MAALLKVLLDQKKYIVDRQNRLIKTEEFQTFNYKGKELPKIGGVVEDNTRKILGYTYDDNKYDFEGNRLKETMAPYNWNNPFVKIDKETVEKYEIKKEPEVKEIKEEKELVPA